MQQLLSTFHLLSGCAGLILTGNTVKHEQKKKDKSARLLKEMKSKAQDAVNLVHHQYIYPPLITRLQTQKKTLELQGLLDEVLLLFSAPTEPQNRSFTGTIFFNDSRSTMPQTKIRFGSYTKNWSGRHNYFMFLLPLSQLLELILGLLCWRAGTHGRKVSNHSQAQQVARKELYQRTSPHKKVL